MIGGRQYVCHFTDILNFAKPALHGGLYRLLPNQVYTGLGWVKQLDSERMFVSLGGRGARCNR